MATKTLKRGKQEAKTRGKQAETQPQLRLDWLSAEEQLRFWCLQQQRLIEGGFIEADPMELADF